MVGSRSSEDLRLASSIPAKVNTPPAVVEEETESTAATATPPRLLSSATRPETIRRRRGGFLEDSTGGAGRGVTRTSWRSLPAVAPTVELLRGAPAPNRGAAIKDGGMGGWHCSDAVRRKKSQGCGLAEGDARFADAVAHTVGGARLAFFSSFCRRVGLEIQLETV
jgi:hypothetical protein